MKRCAHPFIASLAASYKDADSLYLLMELVQGGELFSILRSQQRFQVGVAAPPRLGDPYPSLAPLLALTPYPMHPTLSKLPHG